MGYLPVANFKISKIKLGYPIMVSSKNRAAIMGYQQGFVGWSSPIEKRGSRKD
jgi:hypothetical protein